MSRQNRAIPPSTAPNGQDEGSGGLSAPGTHGSYVPRILPYQTTMPPSTAPYTPGESFGGPSIPNLHGAYGSQPAAPRYQVANPPPAVPQTQYYPEHPSGELNLEHHYYEPSAQHHNPSAQNGMGPARYRVHFPRFFNPAIPYRYPSPENPCDPPRGFDGTTHGYNNTTRGYNDTTHGHRDIGQIYPELPSQEILSNGGRNSNAHNDSAQGGRENGGMMTHLHTQPNLSFENPIPENLMSSQGFVARDIPPFNVPPTQPKSSFGNMIQGNPMFLQGFGERYGPLNQPHAQPSFNPNNPAINNQVTFGGRAPVANYHGNLTYPYGIAQAPNNSTTNNRATIGGRVPVAEYRGDLPYPYGTNQGPNDPTANNRATIGGRVPVAEYRGHLTCSYGTAQAAGTRGMEVEPNINNPEAKKQEQELRQRQRLAKSVQVKQSSSKGVKQGNSGSQAQLQRIRTTRANISEVPLRFSKRQRGRPPSPRASLEYVERFLVEIGPKRRRLCKKGRNGDEGGEKGGKKG